MKKATTALLIGSVLAGSLIATAPVFARGPGDCAFGPQAMESGMRGDPDARMERMGARLGLSAEQRDAMRAIADKHRPQMRTVQDRLVDTRTQLQALTTDGTVDEKQLRTLADAQGKAMADMIVLRTQMRAEMDKVLTDEQREQFPQFRGPHGPRGG